jgi:hypothetical protein
MRALDARKFFTVVFLMCPLAAYAQSGGGGGGSGSAASSGAATGAGRIDRLHAFKRKHLQRDRRQPRVKHLECSQPWDER